MKIALYIEDGLEQIVLTPTSDTEKAILEKIHDGSRQLSLKRGEFYGCRGGWMRQRKRYPNYGGLSGDEPNDESTMIILTPMAVKEAASELPLVTTFDEGAGGGVGNARGQND
jgi:hypothetical protein